MRLKTFLILTVLLLLTGGAVAQDAAAPKLTRLSDAVYAYVGIPSGSPFNQFGANVGVVIGDDAVLVVDTLTSAREANHLIQEIRKITDKPIRYAVNTHYHLDHALGNSAFADLGAIIIAQKECREQLIATGEETLKSAEAFGLPLDFWQNTRIAAPQLTFEREINIDLGGVTVKVLYPGAASHTGGSSIVVVPGQDVLFTGDILFTDFHPFLGEGDFPGWNKALDMIADQKVSRIVPGHGPLSGAKDLADMKEYLATFDARARELSATVKDPKLLAEEMLKVLPLRKDGAFIVEMNINTRYAPQKPAKTE